MLFIWLLLLCFIALWYVTNCHIVLVPTYVLRHVIKFFIIDIPSRLKLLKESKLNLFLNGKVNIFDRDSKVKVINRLLYLKCVVSPFFTPLDIRVTVLDTGKIYILLHCGTASLLHIDLVDSIVLWNQPFLLYRLCNTFPLIVRHHGLGFWFLHNLIWGLNFDILTSNICVLHNPSFNITVSSFWLYVTSFTFNAMHCFYSSSNPSYICIIPSYPCELSRSYDPTYACWWLPRNSRVPAALPPVVPPRVPAVPARWAPSAPARTCALQARLRTTR